MYKFGAMLRSRLFPNLAFVAVIRLEGIIQSGGRGLNLAKLEPILNMAYALEPAAVAVQLNCPGGSPVQSYLLGRRIDELRKKTGIKTYAFCEDVAASGGYMVACASDELYCCPSSLVGSIGVLFNSFGLHNTMEKVGVERRIRSAGENKVLMDPFSPVSDKDETRVGALLSSFHKDFIQVVKDSRGDRLVDEHSDAIFSGEAFTAQEAKDNGLVDGIGDMRSVLQAELEKDGKEVKFIRVNKQSLYDRLWGGNLAQNSMSEGALPGNQTTPSFIATDALSLIKM